MDLDTTDTHTWIQDLPVSELKYPRTIRGYLNRVIWKLYTPHHSWIRDLLLYLGLVRHEGRQPYLFGTIIPELSTKEFILQLVAAGFGHDFIAWKDDEEIASLRYADTFTHQYHLRIFADREVRGHYEYTPESRPIAHMRGVGFEDRREFFMRFLEGKIVLP